ncbi:hypothetical protein SALBM311S_07176 [Streptomyces alboniger]
MPHPAGPHFSGGHHHPAPGPRGDAPGRRLPARRARCGPAGRPYRTDGGGPRSGPDRTGVRPVGDRQAGQHVARRVGHLPGRPPVVGRPVGVWCTGSSRSRSRTSGLPRPAIDSGDPSRSANLCAGFHVHPGEPTGSVRRGTAPGGLDPEWHGRAPGGQISQAGAGGQRSESAENRRILRFLESGERGFAQRVAWELGQFWGRSCRPGGTPSARKWRGTSGTGPLPWRSAD